MDGSVFLTRVVLRNYKSIGHCDVRLGPLTYLVGVNGSGKSHFLDALHLVCDALGRSLDNAIHERGGLSEVRRRSGGHPKHFGIRLEFKLPDRRQGHYAFNVGSPQDRGYEVQTEECGIGDSGRGPFFLIEHGRLEKSSETAFPKVTSDRLALVAASGLTSFRPVFDALTSMGFYHLSPKLMRDLQKPQQGRLLKPSGENIASVMGHLEDVSPGRLAIIEEYLRTIVPTVHGVARKQLGPLETLEFRQDTADAFLAQNMSDGTVHALGVLVALFQGNQDHAPALVGIEEPETALHPAATAALREALTRASRQTQVIVTTHSPDLLDDRSIGSDLLLAAISKGGVTGIAPIDDGSRSLLHQQLFSAGELLRLNQLAPDRRMLTAQQEREADLFPLTSVKVKHS